MFFNWKKSVADAKHTGRPKKSYSNDNTEAVRESVCDNPATPIDSATW